MAENTKSNTNAADTKPTPAPPATIGATATEVAAILAKFTALEQWRIIKAVSTINGIEPTNAQRQAQQSGRR